MPVTLDAAVRTAAEDRRITASEARTLIRVEQASGSKKQLDDVFNAIDRMDAAIDTDATRLLCAGLDQKLTRGEWEHYVQKAASSSGAWGPGSEGTKLVRRGDLPDGTRKVYDRWLKSDPSNKPQVFRFEVAGKPAFLMEQHGEFGTGFGIFDSAGKNIELKEDATNVRRHARNIQQAYDKYFKAPEFAAWKGTIENTDLGIIRNYRANAEQLTGAALDRAMSDAMKQVKREMSKGLGDGARIEIFKNKSDGSLLMVGDSADFRGNTNHALFSAKGELVSAFTIDA